MHAVTYCLLVTYYLLVTYCLLGTQLFCAQVCCMYEERVSELGSYHTYGCLQPCLYPCCPRCRKDLYSSMRYKAAHKSSQCTHWASTNIPISCKVNGSTSSWHTGDVYPVIVFNNTYVVIYIIMVHRGLY
jgi:hypothetical protein